MKSDEMMGGIVIFLFGLATTVLSLRMPIGTFRSAGTGMFPLCLGIFLMALFSLFLLKLSFKTYATGKKLLIGEISGSIKQLILFFGVMILITRTGDDHLSNSLPNPSHDR